MFIVPFAFTGHIAMGPFSVATRSKHAGNCEPFGEKCNAPPTDPAAINSMDWSGFPVNRSITQPPEPAVGRGPDAKCCVTTIPQNSGLAGHRERPEIS
jgi:hypothetical protein